MKDFVVTPENADFVRSVAVSNGKMRCSVIRQTDRMSIGWRGRLMILFGAKIYMENALYCENEPGKTWSEGFVGKIRFGETHGTQNPRPNLRP